MSFTWSLTRCPRPHVPERGAEAADHIPVSEAKPLVEGAAGCSPYLAGLIEKEAEWLTGAFGDTPEKAFARVLAEVTVLDLAGLKSGLRQAKRRVALLTALADLGGVWTLEDVTGALTRFADLAVDVAMKALTDNAQARGKLPETDAPAGGLVALAMGKMGAGELNYSSDIDLVMLFDENAFAPDDYLEARSTLIRCTKQLGAILSEITEGGYVFRTDFRLRPDSGVTPVAMSMEAAERYYESQGRTWERAAYIKARAAAGNTEAGKRFLENLAPFVWRRHLDFAAIEDAYDMRSKIRSHKGLYDRAELEGYDLKLARGGIREIEFFTQTRQLISGGRDPELRLRGTVESLSALADKGWLPLDICATLQTDYRDLRELEHRVQMIGDQQTHALPRDAEGFDRLAALMDRGVEELRADIAKRRDRVGKIADEFFNPPSTRQASADIPPEMDEIVQRWPSYPALRSPRAVERFQRVQPVLLERLGEVEHPTEALRHIDSFLSGLPAGVQLFSLFEANPHLIDLVVDIASVSPDLAGYLGRNSSVFDAVIAGQFFEDWPDVGGLRSDLLGQLAEETDYEAQLDRARRWAKEWHFRIGVHHLRGLIDAETAGVQYADLAEAVLQAVGHPVMEEFERKHGPAPGQGAMILGMGSLGARRLNAASDVDVIAIYDAEGAEGSDGPRPLATRPYFARLTQAFITALTAPMSQGRLYEVDMRLRPSGRQGPVATSLMSFAAYQKNDAWTWEHLALTRARPISGAPALQAAVSNVRASVLASEHDVRKTLADVADMRARLSAAQKPGGPLDARIGPGRLHDISLLAQAGALLAGSDARDVDIQISEGADALGLSSGEAEHLRATNTLLWSVHAATRLIGGAVQGDVGSAAARFLLRGQDQSSVVELCGHLDRAADTAAKIIDRVLASAK